VNNNTFFKTLLLLGIFTISCFSCKKSIPQDEPADRIDVSHSQGVPLGGLGNGYSVFGQYGFIRVNFNGYPDRIPYGYETPDTVYSYTMKPDSGKLAPFGFVLQEGAKQYAFQTQKATWAPGAESFDTVKAFAYLPKAWFSFIKNELGLNVSVEAFTPLVREDIATSSTPVQVFEIVVENPGTTDRNIGLLLNHKNQGMALGNKAIFKDASGELGFAAENGKATSNGVSVQLDVPAGTTQKARFFIGWYYPAVKHVSEDTRYYTVLYKDVSDVLDQSMVKADDWKLGIEAWHNSLEVPVFLKRLWFSSLSSVMTSTIMGQGPSFYEIETPHSFLNTMDVVCYSSWAYLINWPELEKIDMEQYLEIIHTSGDKKGYVWHSAIKDEANYVEEPCYLTRAYRDYLWFNDKQFLSKVYPYAEMAAERVYRVDGYDYLINSDHGNQSYDLWKMPGISAFINVAWVYGQHGFEKMSEVMGREASIGNIPIAEFRQKSLNSFDSLLWNPDPGYYNCFYRTPTADKKGNPNTIFSDQLFGKWMLAIARDANEVLPPEKIKQSLLTIYGHNLIEGPEENFRGWANGLRPGRTIDTTGYHANMFWFGAQLNLASLLGMMGEEAASLDVIQSVETSLNNNHLAAGEWNRTFNADLELMRSVDEPGKDTPRFPAYPRYKSGWEYLVRMLGMQMDEKYFYFDPFKTIAFSLHDYMLAGTRFTVSVEPGWQKVLLNGSEISGEVRVARSMSNCKIDFVK
jgi:uncharacterized protein (DUF608 family)